MSQTKKDIIRVVGRTGKTKGEISDALGLSYSHTAKTVNDLLYAGQLQIKSTDGRKTIFQTPPRNAPAAPVSGKLIR